MGAVVVGIIIVAVIVGWVVQQAQAHGRPLEPHSIRGEVGPIVRRYRSTPDPGAMITRAVAGIAGMTVAHAGDGVIFVNSRPNVTRIDDGSGMFLRIAHRGDDTGWTMTIDGDPKASLANSTRAWSALRSCERQIRQALGRLGCPADDELGTPGSPGGVAPAPPMPSPPVVASPPPPPPPPAPVPEPDLATRGRSGEPPPPPADVAVGDALDEPTVQRPLTARLIGLRELHELGDRTVVGRDPTPSEWPGARRVVIPDPLLSKGHLVIGRSDRGFWVQECGSRNGTHLERGVVVRALTAGVVEPLLHGDVLVLGEQRLRIEMDQGEETAWVSS